MFLGIAGHTDAELGTVVRIGFGINEDASVHIAYLLHQCISMRMSAWDGDEAVCAWHSISAQSQNILDAEEV